MTVVVRFAPSPTGLLHVGNVRAALVNWLFARKEGGRFVLRIDDTDTERSEARFEKAIIEDLDWLGLAHDLFIRQSERGALYEAAAARLRAAGRLYPCYETPDELERKRRRQLARHAAPVYDRAALKLSAEERAALEAEGRVPHWRFYLGEGRTVWDDLIRGRTEIDRDTVSDPVLVRSDGQFLYTLPSVIDDAELKVSHVIRGEDHVTNTAVQIALFEALGVEVPAFAHYPLLLAADGGPLSKRLGSLSIAELRGDGIEPMAVLSLLARLGTADPIEAVAERQALIAGFDLGRIGRAPARFDPGELQTVNARVLHGMTFADFRAGHAGTVKEADGVLFEAVKANLTKASDLDFWRRIVEGPLVPVIEEEAFLKAAANALPTAPFDEETWGTWTRALSAATGRKGRALYHPLRLALTGLDHGPEMKKLLVLIGHGRAQRRLSGEQA